MEWVKLMGTKAKGITHRTRDAAADKGTAIHEYIETILAGSIPQAIPEEYRQAINNFVMWYADSGINSIEFSELPVTNAKT